jgi:hypothetical protein
MVESLTKLYRMLFRGLEASLLHLLVAGTACPASKPRLAFLGQLSSSNLSLGGVIYSSLLAKEDFGLLHRVAMQRVLVLCYWLGSLPDYTKTLRDGPRVCKPHYFHLPLSKSMPRVPLSDSIVKSLAIYDEVLSSRSR